MRFAPSKSPAGPRSPTALRFILAIPKPLENEDIMKPEYGIPPTIEEGEVPVFWACGITPQVVMANARPEICITHKAAHMLITDLPSKVSAEALPKLAEA